MQRDDALLSILPRLEQGDLAFRAVMKKAADLIEKRGYIQGGFYMSSSPTAPLCAFAAVYEAQYGRRVDFYGVFTGESYHRKLEEWLGKSICVFNNTHSQEEVVAMLRRAAVEA